MNEPVSVQPVEVLVSEVPVRLAVAEHVPRDDHDGVAHGRDGFLVAAPAMSQHAAMVAPRGPQTCLAERLAVFRARRAFFLARPVAVGVPCVPPDGTFHVMVDIRQAGLTSEREGVFVYPGGYFGASGEGFERVSLVVPESVLADTVERLARVYRRPR